MAAKLSGAPTAISPQASNANLDIRLLLIAQYTITADNSGTFPQELQHRLPCCKGGIRSR